TGALADAGSQNVRACLDSSPVKAQTGMALNAQQQANLDKLLKYLVQCALPDAHSVSIYQADGTAKTYTGALGLAPEWATGALTDEGPCASRCTRSADGTYTNCAGESEVMTTFLPFRAEGSVGGAASCIKRTDGQTMCWGYNAEGELGNGGTATSTTPVMVTT